MGTIVAFTPGRRSPNPQPNEAVAEILWFTGVRYVRVDAIDAASTPKPVRRRAKRPPRPSVVRA